MAFLNLMKMDCYLHVVDVAVMLVKEQMVLLQLELPESLVQLVALVVLQLTSLLPLVIQEVDPQLKQFLLEPFSQQLS